jgi:hypothetical protein
MISNQLIASDMTIEALLAGVPEGTRVLKWNGTGYTFYDYVDIGVGAPIWSPDGSATLAPGEGAFISNTSGADFTITFVGEVPQGADSNTAIPAGTSIQSSSVPTAGLVQSELGLPVEENDRVLTWEGNGYAFHDYVDIGIGSLIWSPEEPSVAVGESFFVQKANASNWDRNFSVNN